ncbi:hypothetical protein L600_002800000010, partial [Isoptericola variabilis J7]
MESAAGLAALALFVLWLGYWVPQRLRHRQQLLESRVEDRFSGGLRVLAVAGGGPSAAIAPPAERASRLALLERRAARARRRLVLTLLLVVLTAV